MIQNSKYEKNIDVIAALIYSAMIEQRDKIPPANSNYEKVVSFFVDDDENNEHPNIYVKRYSPLEISEANTIIINISNVLLTNSNVHTQTASTTYNIDFICKIESDAKTLDAILYVCQIVRETLVRTDIQVFYATKKQVEKIEILHDKMNDDADNIMTARIVFVVDTSEGLTDLDEPNSNGGIAQANDTKIMVNNGTYKLFKEW